jgi:hypothetical protein
MATVENWLLCRRLAALADEVAAAAPGEADAVWERMERVVEDAGAAEDADVALPVLERSLPLVRALLVAWDAGTRPLSAWDAAVLHRAMNAYRKRRKLMRLDDESSASRNPLSRGGTSDIVGIRPPERFPQEVWDLLVARGRLRDAGHGLLEPC